jgi:DNA-binding CsgD family transcriptional regulator
MVARDGVIGRDEELAVVGAMLEGVAGGFRALLLRGEAGMGKTTLWRAGIELADERAFRMLVASPAAAETEMSFAALGDLLGGVVDEVLSRLPEPQRHALEVALLVADATGAGSDQRAVAVAFTSALRALAETGPVLVAVDDVQWLDAASGSVLGYAARRLRDERVGLLLTERTAAATGLPLELDRARSRERIASLRVGALSLGATRGMLRQQLGLVVARPTLMRIHETAGGNPFYSLELARALEREGLDPGPGQPLRLPESLGELVRRRIAALPPDTREVLLAAAAVSEPRISLLEAAIGADPRAPLAAAVESEVVAVERGRLRFAHPLLAAATYELAGEAERRALHRRLAGVVGELEAQARHLALGAEGPDAEVALTLDRAARHALTRGASPVAAELSEQARQLTPPERAADVHRRVIAAASARFLAGETGRARTLLEEALPSIPAGGLRTKALVLLGQVHRYGGSQPRAAELLRQALAEPIADERLHADAAQGLASTLLFMREELGVARHHAAVAAELAARGDSPALLAEVLATKQLIEGVLGHAEAQRTQQAAAELGEEIRPDRVVSSASFIRGYFFILTDGVDEGTALMRGCREEARTRGDESSLPLILASLALLEYLGGRWREATRVADEGLEVALETGQRPWYALSLSARALVNASLGLEEAARADALDALALAGERAIAVARIHAVWALGLLELSLDQPEEAALVLRPERERLLAAGVGEPGSVRFVPDEIEALLGLSRLADAERLLGWLEDRGRALDRAWALAAAWRSRGLMLAARGQGSAAVEAFDRALAEHDRVSMPFDRARTVLALGSAQRRGKRKREARETLTEALRTFDLLDATIWAERTRREIERISGRAPSRDELTPTERRVVELVAEGRTNREVAAALVVSPRTVEFHLRNVFRKLDLHTRAEIVHRFAAR